MIASVRGMVRIVRLDSAVLEVGGVGMNLICTPATLATMKVDQEASLFTSLVVREDSLTLFGFATDDERSVFEAVQKVSGVGPRLALAMLAVHSPDALRAAVHGENVAALQQVPGIGKKGAQRMVLELAGKLGEVTGGFTPEADVNSAQTGAAAAAWQDPVTEALVGLGYSVKQAEAAVQSLASRHASGDDTVDLRDELDAASALRLVLRELGRTGRS